MRKFSHFSVVCALLLTGSFAGPAFAASATFTAAIGSESGQQVTTPVTWTVTRLTDANKPDPKTTTSQVGPVFKADLKPGHYIVVAQNQGIAAQQTVFVGQSGVKQAIVLGMSQLSINMIASSGRKPIADAIKWEVYTYQKGATEAGAQVAKATGPSAQFSLPAGGYVVRAMYKDTRADLVVPMVAGQKYDYTINLYAGYAKLSAVANNQAVKQKVTYQIVHQKPNDKGEYELVAEREEAAPNVMLREGNYLLIARYGKMWGRQLLVVQAGQTKSVKVTMKEAAGAPVVVTASN